MIDYNVYYSPEQFNLRTIGEVEFSSGSYEFDLTVIWQDVTTGELYYFDDSGCSCPSPFGSTSLSDLHHIQRLQVLIDHLESRVKEVYDHEDRQRLSGECGQLVQTVREATMRALTER